MTQTAQNLDLILFAWVDALRRRDPKAIADRVAPDIVWHGLRRDLVCPNRTAVLHNITAGGPVRERVTGIEITAVDEHRVLLGVQLPGVTEFFGETLEGGMFDVFTINEGIIVRIDEFKTGRADRRDPQRQRHPRQLRVVREARLGQRDKQPTARKPKGPSPQGS